MYNTVKSRINILCLFIKKIPIYETPMHDLVTTSYQIIG